MALKQNTTLLAQLPLRQIGGSPGTFRAMWSRGDRLNQSVGQGISSKLAGIPSGHLAPSSWVLPYKPGAMSSFTQCVVTLTPGTLNLAAGINLDGTSTFTFAVGPSDGQLVASAIGSTSITFSAAANLAGALSAAGSTSFSFTVNNATLGAIVDAVGAALVQVSASANIRATGNLSGDITPFTELSPQSLSAAVWEALASAYNTPGSMGELLNSAGSAADPLLGVVEGGLTLRDVMRLLLAVNAGDATGLESGAMVFKSQDGTTDRVEATYSSGARTVTAVDPA
jgi:hypothetical protein